MGQRGPKNIYERTAIKARTNGRDKTDVRPPPTHLSQEAKRWWLDVVARFGIESHRYQTLQSACEAWDLSQLARRALAKGLSYKDTKGQWRAMPEVAIARDARTAYLRSLRELKIDASPPTSPTQQLGPSALFPHNGGETPLHQARRNPWDRV
jgi:phage terminase small subunit